MVIIYALIDSNNVVKGCGFNKVSPFENGIEIETDLSTIDLADNYKVVDNQLVELTEEEKTSLTSMLEPTLTERVADVEIALAEMIGGV